MSIIRITKKQIDEADKARRAALGKDPEFQAFAEEREKLLKEALDQHEHEKGAS